jgi:hypothetical protein
MVAIQLPKEICEMKPLTTTIRCLAGLIACNGDDIIWKARIEAGSQYSARSNAVEMNREQDLFTKICFGTLEGKEAWIARECGTDLPGFVADEIWTALEFVKNPGYSEADSDGSDIRWPE